MRRIVILGAGTAGTIMANRLRKVYRGQLRSGKMSITVVDQDDRHLYQPGLVFVPFGMGGTEGLVRSRERYVSEDVRFVAAKVLRVAPEEDKVYLEGGEVLDYHVLIVASGVGLAPEETAGLTDAGWGEKMFDFYTLEGASALAGKLADFNGGRLVLNIVDMPIKCPVAPLEFVFLADSYFTKRGIRDRVDISLVTPLDGAFTRPIASKAFGSMMADKGIEIVTEFAAGEVDGVGGKLKSWDEREVDFDLLVTIPLHGGAAFVGESPGLGDEFNFVLTDPKTLQAQCKENIFALGDATNLPTSKAGSVAHFQTEVLTDNIVRFLRDEPLLEAFDGHANCFVETGFNKAMLIDFNYEVEPLPGKFPLAGIGPMRLLKETRANHWGKLAFEWVYWNMLLPGRDIPMVSAQMSMKGKQLPAGAGVTGAAA